MTPKLSMFNILKIANLAILLVQVNVSLLSRRLSTVGVIHCVFP